MKTINSVLDTFQQSQAEKQHPQSSGDSQQGPQRKVTTRTIEMLWDKMSAMFGHRWTSSFGEKTDPDGVWMRCLQELTPHDIGNGLNAVALSGMDWPPTAPQFREMCVNHALINLPSADEAYFELCHFMRSGSRNYQLLSPATYWAWRTLDHWNFRHMNADKAEKTFRAAYKLALDHARKGGEFAPVPVASLESGIKKGGGVVISEATRKKGKRIMNELMEMMRSSS